MTKERERRRAARNPHVGYHYHAVTDCLSGAPTTVDVSDVAANAADQIGIAMAGHAIFGNRLADGQAPEDLDRRYGQKTEGLPYHYLAGEAGSNQILGCLAAETGCTLVERQTVCDASNPPPRP